MYPACGVGWEHEVRVSRMQFPCLGLLSPGSCELVMVNPGECPSSSGVLGVSNANPHGSHLQPAPGTVPSKRVVKSIDFQARLIWIQQCG